MRHRPLDWSSPLLRGKYKHFEALRQQLLECRFLETSAHVFVRHRLEYYCKVLQLSWLDYTYTSCARHNRYTGPFRKRTAAASYHRRGHHLLHYLPSSTYGRGKLLWMVRRCTVRVCFERRWHFQVLASSLSWRLSLGPMVKHEYIY